MYSNTFNLQHIARQQLDETRRRTRAGHTGDRTPARLLPARRTSASRTRRPWVLAALVSVLLVSAGGCGPGDRTPAIAGEAGGAGASPGRPLDPCSVLTSSTLDSLAGSHLDQEGPATTQARGLACRWSFADRGVARPATLVVTAWHGREFYLPGTIGEDVEGIGDEAQFDPSLGMALMRRGEEVIGTQVLSSSRKDLALDVARAVADAL